MTESAGEILVANYDEWNEFQAWKQAREKISAKSYFECHVTMLGDPDTIRPHVEDLKWKFSVIAGDPVPGPGLKCYATRLFPVRFGMEVVMEFLLATATQLTKAGCEVISRKVEYVMFDDKPARRNGGCSGCHLDDLESRKPTYDEKEMQKLIDFFRHDAAGVEFGRRGDYNDWTTVETAINAMRALHDIRMHMTGVEMTLRREGLI